MSALLVRTTPVFVGSAGQSQKGAGCAQGAEPALRPAPRHSPERSLAISAQERSLASCAWCSVPQQAASMLLGHHASLYLCRSCRFLSWCQNWAIICAGVAWCNSWCQSVRGEETSRRQMQVKPRRCLSPRFLPGSVAGAAKPLQTP